MCASCVANGNQYISTSARKQELPVFFLSFSPPSDLRDVTEGRRDEEKKSPLLLLLLEPVTHSLTDSHFYSLSSPFRYT